MAIVAVSNGDRSLCISGDSGSGIFVWCVDSSLKEEPLKQWYEHNDWLYRGLHCLAVSRTGYLYTGSRDKSVKAWSLEVKHTKLCFIKAMYWNHRLLYLNISFAHFGFLCISY
jgi:WD40 repeat protein